MHTPWKLPVGWLLLLLSLRSFQAQHFDTMPSGDAAELEFSRRLAIFSINVYSQLSQLKPQENVVFSPFSIQTCAAMARLGAGGKTATELDQGLGLVSTDTQKIAESFHQVLAHYEKSEILRIANKIYVMQGYNLRDEFNKLLTQQFLSAAENVDFSKTAQAAATINQWVEQKTNNLIKDLVPPSVLDANSRLVLVNAIHFKGKWVHQFPKHATRPEPFHLNDEQNVNVPMMNLKASLRYAELPELDATALELPYKDSDLSMLVILPRSKTGLPQLEEKLRTKPLAEISEKLHKTQVLVKLPKFKSEFQVELTEVFKQLGMSRMFSNEAEFGGMLQSSEQLKVSAIIHKAFIDVNEEGTEAAAATAMGYHFLSARPSHRPKYFLADHPFYFSIINDSKTVVFAGNLLKP